MHVTCLKLFLVHDAHTREWKNRSNSSAKFRRPFGEAFQRAYFSVYSLEVLYERRILHQQSP